MDQTKHVSVRHLSRCQRQLVSSQSRIFFGLTLNFLQDYCLQATVSWVLAGGSELWTSLVWKPQLSAYQLCDPGKDSGGPWVSFLICERQCIPPRAIMRNK